MLQQATYTSGHRTLRVSVERQEVLLRSEDPLNFPRIIELEGDRLVLAYGRGQHGGDETRPVAISNDAGRTWADAPPGFPMADNVQTSGIMGYLRDGTIAYIDVFPANATWSSGSLYHRQAMVEDPVFRLRRFTRQPELLEDSTFKVRNLAWKSATYELYGTLLELEDGDLLAAFLGHVGAPSETRYNFTDFIVRSTDGGKSFEHVWSFEPEIDGKPVGDEGFSEPDMAVLANGDILCVMRTGSYSSMYQSRSTDGGWTWSQPQPIGWPGVKPDLRLLSNGVLACSSGRGMYGQPQITYAMFSLDGTGQVWECPLAFHTGPGCSYTSNMERDGKLYVAYSDSSFWSPPGTFGLPYQSIKWVVLKLECSG